MTFFTNFKTGKLFNCVMSELNVMYSTNFKNRNIFSPSCLTKSDLYY